MLVLSAAAVMLAAAAVPAQAARHGRWCLSQYNVGPNTNCTFRSLAACVAAKTGNNDSCTPSGGRSTTDGMRSYK
jgi:nucleoside-diphosphate-sugar epimerase